MMKKCTFGLIALFCLALSTQTNAQKYGHMNLGLLMEMMPEVESANATLVALNDSLTNQDSIMASAFRADYETYVTAAQAGTMTRLQMEEKERELQQRQNAILAFEEQAKQMVETKKAQLLSPMLTRIDDAIKAVAKENGYAMIFDTSVGGTLFVDDSEDVSELVKAKLGITK